AKRVSTKFLQKSIGQHKRDHRFAGNSRRRNHTPIRPLIRCLHRLLSYHVRRSKRATQRRNRLQVPAHNHIFPVRDSAFEPPPAIRPPHKLLRSFTVRNLVLHFASERSRRQNPNANLSAFHRLNAHHRLRQPPIQLFLPLCVRTHSNGNVVRDHFKDSTNRIPCFQHCVHFHFHLLLQRAINAPQRRIQIPANLLDLVPTRLPL